MNNFDSANKGNLKNDALPKKKNENLMNNNIQQIQKIENENINIVWFKYFFTIYC